MSNLQRVIENADLIDERTHRTLLASLVNQLADGKSNAFGSFTLAASTTTTTVTDNRFQSEMVPVYIPITANASAEIGAGTIYVSNRTQGSFTLTHANNAQTDRDFIYIRIG